MSDIEVIEFCNVHREAYCQHCPDYPTDTVLPDENGLCSLCGKHEA